MSGGGPALPYGRHLIEDDDVAAVAAVLRSDTLTTGPVVPAFEAALCERTGARFAVACGSGTAGLHLASLALGLGPGDAVVVPSLTFLATANGPRHAGAEVVFADVDPETGLLGPRELEEAMRRAAGLRVRAVFPVHLNGQCADPAALQAVARTHDLRVVEDACHALGADYTVPGATESQPVGGIVHADMAVFSFHPVKAVAMGEGGAVTADDPDLARRLARLRSHGMVRESDAFESAELGFAPEGGANPWYYEMHEPGFNYRASDIQCALGLSQLRKLDRFVARRRALADRYDAALAPLAPLVRPPARVPGCRPAWHLYAARIDFAAAKRSRARVVHELRARGFGSQVHYLPVHLQPYYRRRYGTLELPGARHYYERCLSLPLFPAMGDEDVDRVVAALRDALGA